LTLQPSGEAAFAEGGPQGQGKVGDFKALTRRALFSWKIYPQEKIELIHRQLWSKNLFLRSLCLRQKNFQKILAIGT
jgi:hypothetical protein